MSQLPLPVGLKDHAVFDTFHPPGNEELVAYVSSQAVRPATPGCYIWGPTASGKTHLLQALCDKVGDRSIYLPLADLRRHGPQSLEGLEIRQFVCLDDVDAVSGDPAWDQGLFRLWNAVVHAGGVLLSAPIGLRGPLKSNWPIYSADWPN